MSAKPQMISEQKLKIPRSALSSVPHRISFDNGSTLCKIVYVTEADADHFELNLLTVTKKHFDDTIRWIKASGLCKLKGDGSDVVKMTGVNFDHNKLLSEQFKASGEHVIELLTQVRGCHWLLSNLPEDVALLPEEKPEEQFKPKSENELLSKMATHMSVEDKLSGKFPAVLAHIGTTSMISVVSETGTLQSFNFSMFSAKSMLGMAKLMVGTADYDELFALAERGDRKGVDLLIGDIFGHDPTGPYGQMDPTLPMLQFGKAADGTLPEGGAKREDAARSLISLFCWNLFSAICSVCRTTNTATVYITGNFFKHQLARTEFANACSLLKITAANFQPRFLRAAGHIGAVGALVATNADAAVYMKFA